MKIYEVKLTYSQIGEDASTKLDAPELVVKYASKLFDESPYQEQFIAIFLDRKNKLAGINRVTTGTLDSSLVHPRDVFRVAIMANAAAIIVCHNHPSGDPKPSTQDHRVTETLKEAAVVLNIDFLDHVILGDKNEDPTGIGYYSFNEEGVI